MHAGGDQFGFRLIVINVDRYGRHRLIVGAYLPRRLQSELLGPARDQPRGMIGGLGERHQVGRIADLREGVFGVTPGTELLLRTFRKADRKTGALHEWSVSYIPVDLIKGNPDIIDKADQPWPGGTQHQLYTVGIEVMQIVDEVTCTMPTTVDQQLWDLEDGVPLLAVRRISIDDQDRVVEVSNAVFPGDRTKLIFTTPLKKW